MEYHLSVQLPADCLVSVTETDNFAEAFFLEHFARLICSAAIWFQNTSMYHFSIFHASHHLEPIVATEDEVSILSD